MGAIENKQRFVGFDILKCVCALMIVMLHFQIPEPAGRILAPITKIAVPIFFMISGYFYRRLVDKGREKKHLLKILWITLAANAFYFAVYAAGHFIKGDLVPYLKGVFTLNNLVEFVVFNESPFAVHLWFLTAMIYVLLIAMLLRKLGRLSWLYYVTPVLLIVDLLLGRYSALIFGAPLETYVSRNFLLAGLPYFSIGLFLSDKKRRPPAWALIVITAVSTFTSLLAKDLTLIVGFEVKREHYLSTTVLAVAVFMLFELVFDGYTPHAFGRLMAKTGKEYSTWIYILHLLVGSALGAVFKKLYMYEAFRWVQGITTFMLTLLIVALAVFLVKTVVKKIKGK